MINLDLTSYQLPPKKKTSQRAEIIKELYNLYEEDKINRKKDNWKRYIQWLKDNRYTNSKDLQQRFKKDRKYIKQVAVSSFCFLIAHLSEKELLYIRSVGLDKKARKENVGGYIAGHFSKISK